MPRYMLEWQSVVNWNFAASRHLLFGEARLSCQKLLLQSNLLLDGFAGKLGGGFGHEGDYGIDEPDQFSRSFAGPGV